MDPLFEYLRLTREFESATTFAEKRAIAKKLQELNEVDEAEDNAGGLRIV